MSYIEFGTFFGTESVASDHSRLIPFPVRGEPQTVMEWGYDKGAVEPAGWVTSPDLREGFDLPEQAVAVRLHIKAKTKTITWTPVDVMADLQVALRPLGYTESPNEIIHAYCNQKAGSNLSNEDINSVSTDILLGEDGKIELYRHPTVIGSYGTILLAVYFAGFWMPLKERVS